MDEYSQLRTIDVDRSQKMVNNRFPELQAAREAFLGKEQKMSGTKNKHASEVVDFADVVEKLAQEEEPFAGRAQMMQTRNVEGRAG